MIDHIPNRYKLLPVDRVEVYTDGNVLTDTFIPLGGIVYLYYDQYYFDVPGCYWVWKKQFVKIIFTENNSQNVD